MKKQILLPLLLAAFAVLIGGAYLLYNALGDRVDSNQLSQQETQGDSTTEPETIPAPDFTVYDREGNAVTLSQYIGKPIVLNFWASWCPPCKAEMPHFQEKYEELGDKIQFLMINATGGRETVASAVHFLEEQGYTFPVFYDTQNNAVSTYGAYSLPTTLFIDAKGNVVTGAMGMLNAQQLQIGIDRITAQEERM